MADDINDPKAPAEAAATPAPKKKATSNKRKSSCKKGGKSVPKEISDLGKATGPLKPVERTLNHPDAPV